MEPRVAPSSKDRCLWEGPSTFDRFRSDLHSTFLGFWLDGSVIRDSTMVGRQRFIATKRLARL